MNCQDCKEKITEGYSYDVENKSFYKCKECYEKNNDLENFRECLVFSRIVGYYSPTSLWNPGKKGEFSDRVEFDVKKS